MHNKLVSNHYIKSVFFLIRLEVWGILIVKFLEFNEVYKIYDGKKFQSSISVPEFVLLLFCCILNLSAVHNALKLE